MYEDNLKRSIARLKIRKERSKLGISEVFAFMIREKSSSNGTEVATCVLDFFDTSKMRLGQQQRCAKDCVNLEVNTYAAATYGSGVVV